MLRPSICERLTKRSKTAHDMVIESRCGLPECSEVISQSKARYVLGMS